MSTTTHCFLVEYLDPATLALVCQVNEAWIIERRNAGLLGDGCAGTSPSSASQLLKRVQRMRNIERDFEANPELAALVADLLERIEQLETQSTLYRTTTPETTVEDMEDMIVSISSQ